MTDGSTGRRVFQYEVVPVTITRGADRNEAGGEWATLRSGLNERGQDGFRIVAVSEGAEGRAVIMEREFEDDTGKLDGNAYQTVPDTAEPTTQDPADHSGQPLPHRAGRDDDA